MLGIGVGRGTNRADIVGVMNPTAESIFVKERYITRRKTHSLTPMKSSLSTKELTLTSPCVLGSELDRASLRGLAKTETKESARYTLRIGGVNIVALGASGLLRGP